MYTDPLIAGSLGRNESKVVGMYRVGFPFWKVAARSGVRMKMRIDVHQDDEAGVFFATSRDLPGLVVEAHDLDELAKEIRAAAAELLTEELRSPMKKEPVTDLRLCAA